MAEVFDIKEYIKKRNQAAFDKKLANNILIADKINMIIGNDAEDYFDDDDYEGKIYDAE